MTRGGEAYAVQKLAGVQTGGGCKQVGDQKRGGQGSAKERWAAHGGAQGRERGTVALVLTSINAMPAPSSPLFASFLLCSILLSCISPCYNFRHSYFLYSLSFPSSLIARAGSSFLNYDITMMSL